MNDNSKITVPQWHELSGDEKEILRTWAVKHDFGLDIIPNSSGSFDPSCDYAALLSNEQVRAFLKEHDREVADDNLLWEEVKKVLAAKNS